jgi:hypothetical protein
LEANALSFDPRHPWLPLPGTAGLEWAVEVFTTEDAYGLDPAMTTFANGRLQARGLQWLGGQRRVAGRVDASVETDQGSHVWRIIAETEGLVKGVKLLVRGLLATTSIPGWWTPTTPADSWLSPTRDQPVHLTYPWPDWQTPWACRGEGPGITVSLRDTKVRPKRLHVSKPYWSASDVLEIVTDESAVALSSRFEAPEIRLRECVSQQEVHEDFREHLTALESVYGLVSWEERGDVPTWARNLDLVLTLHGQHWTGFVFNTFDQMAGILNDVTTDVPGDRILAYLPGWEGRYYWQYPDYRPGQDLGGDEGFSRLVATARRLGVHLMPMFGANGAHVDRYPDWERAALRSPSNNYVALINAPDWDNDRAPEDDQVFLNPGEPRFRQHLVQKVIDLIERHAVDGVFLDTSGCWFNDPRFEMFPGFQELVGEIRGRHPELLVCGEGWYDALLSVFPMNQTWLDMSLPPRFDDLPARYARTLGHLKDGAPGAGSTGVHEGGVRALGRPLRVNGYIPALSVVDDTFTKHRQAVREFCRAVVGERL